MGPRWGSGSRTANLSKKKDRKMTNPHPHHLRNILPCYWRMFIVRSDTDACTAQVWPLAHMHNTVPMVQDKAKVVPQGQSLRIKATHTLIYTSSCNSLCSRSTGLRPGVLMSAKWFPHFIQDAFFFVLALLCFWTWRQIELQRPKREV